MKNLHEKLPAVGRAFVAINNDGSDSDLLRRNPDENGFPIFVDVLGEPCDEGHLYDCGLLYWHYLPKDFKLWFELKGKPTP